MNPWRHAILCSLIAAAAFPFLPSFPQSPPHQQDAPQPIYSENARDSWNRIFYCLFTRRFAARISNEYPAAAPFIPFPPDGPLRISTRTFERLEIGDRAIDPLYPAVGTAGVGLAVTDPMYSMLAKALQDAVNENATRSAVARAVMQSDLWSAYDELFYDQYTRPDQIALEQHRRVIVDLLGRLIRKIALTPEEIRSLPDNYSTVMRRQSLPDLFAKNSGWIEILWFPRRVHEEAANDRRVARVFLKPSHGARDLQKLVSAQRELGIGPAADLDGVALLMQLLLIDKNGKLTPTTLTTDVQVRLFERTAAGALNRTKIQMAEISRRLLLTDPAWGGLTPETEDSPAYLPNSGSDYSFASPQVAVEGPPIQIHLRTRCGACHEEDLTQVMTLNIALPPHSLAPPVRQLDSAASQEADDVISRKKNRREFRALSAYFEKSWRR